MLLGGVLCFCVFVFFGGCFFMFLVFFSVLGSFWGCFGIFLGVFEGVFQGVFWHFLGGV